MVALIVMSCSNVRSSESCLCFVLIGFHWESAFFWFLGSFSFPA